MKISGRMQYDPETGTLDLEDGNGDWIEIASLTEHNDPLIEAVAQGLAARWNAIEKVRGVVHKAILDTEGKDE